DTARSSRRRKDRYSASVVDHARRKPICAVDDSTKNDDPIAPDRASETPGFDLHIRSIIENVLSAHHLQYDDRIRIEIALEHLLHVQLVIRGHIVPMLAQM